MTAVCIQNAVAGLAGNPYNAVVELVDVGAPGGGPLSGVAVVVKDLIDVAGVPTRCGSAVLADAAPARQDAAVVAALRAAGAVVLAKSHTHEFGYGPTGDVAATGPCRNPHDAARITGGSSSGSAALVAAGVVPLAVGTDTGGSGRIPAALCGVVGFKPARGVLPTAGVFPLSETLDHIALLGAGTHLVATAFSALTGHPIDPAAPVAGTVVGRPAAAYWQAHDPEITTAVDRAADALSAAGAVLRELPTPEIDEFAATYHVIVGAEAHATHHHWLTQRSSGYQPATAARLHAAAGYTVTDYITARRTRRRLAAELTARIRRDGIEVLLLPSTPVRATSIGARRVAAPDGTTCEVVPALLSLTQPFNLLGWPALSVPAPEVTGLPIGIQLATPPGGDQVMFAAAALVSAPPASRAAG